MAIVRRGNPKWRIHPGEILREEYLKPLSLSATALARELNVWAPTGNDRTLYEVSRAAKNA